MTHLYNVIIKSTMTVIKFVLMMFYQWILLCLYLYFMYTSFFLGH